MMYNYKEIKPKILTDQGQRRFLTVRDHVNNLLDKSGAFMMHNGFVGTGVSWETMVCIDRMVELNEILEVPNKWSSAGQHRIFISAKSN